MIEVRKWKNSRVAVVTGATMLVVLGAAGGAGAVQATRPTVEMAPTVRTPIARLATSSGLVTVKGRVAEVYGDRFVIQDASGRAMVAAGRDARGAVGVGQPVMVQGRFDDGQLRASYLVDRNGDVAAVGPHGPRPDGPGGPGPRGPGRDGPPPPPPPGCAPAPGGPGAVPPPQQANGVAPSAKLAVPPSPAAAPLTPSPEHVSPAIGTARPQS